jgi:hypothetical protein
MKHAGYEAMQGGVGKATWRCAAQHKEAHLRKQPQAESPLLDHTTRVVSLTRAAGWLKLWMVRDVAVVLRIHHLNTTAQEEP